MKFVLIDNTNIGSYWSPESIQSHTGPFIWAHQDETFIFLVRRCWRNWPGACQNVSRTVSDTTEEVPSTKFTSFTINFLLFSINYVELFSWIYWKFLNPEESYVLLCYGYINVFHLLLIDSGDQYEPIFVLSIVTNLNYDLYEALNPCFPWTRLRWPPLYYEQNTKQTCSLFTFIYIYLTQFKFTINYISSSCLCTALLFI